MDLYASVKVVNRRAVPYDAQYNGVVLPFKPLEGKFYPPNVAISIVRTSALRMNLATGVPQDFALGIEGDPEYPTEPLDGEIASTNPVECLDRTQDYQLTETEPHALTKGSLTPLGIGKKKKTVPPAPAEDVGVMPGDRVEPKPAHEMKAKRFVNQAVRRGPQHESGFTHVEGGPTRVASKSS